MAREKAPQETAAGPAAVSSPTFQVVGFQISDEMFIAVDGRQVNLANPSAELTAWLYERREMLSGLSWTE
jgi:hypothetical protein